MKRAAHIFDVDGVMHWYEGKLSMATIDKPAGVDPKDFLEQGRPLASALQQEFASEHVKIKHNPDAIDVTTPKQANGQAPSSFTTGCKVRRQPVSLTLSAWATTFRTMEWRGSLPGRTTSWNLFLRVRHLAIPSSTRT